MYRFLLLVALILPFDYLHALRLTPSSYELEPAGSRSSHVFEVVNDSSNIIAVQVTVVTRSWDLEQKEVNTPTEDFDIFPSQLILRADEKKGVRVRWKGDKKLDNEKSYRLLVQQLPVNFSKDKKDSGMKVLRNVVGALYVTPKGSEFKIELGDPTKMTLITDEKTNSKGDFLVFNAKNTGSKHILLNHLSLVAKNDKNSVQITPDMLSKLSTQNVLPGSTLTVKLPWPTELGESVSHIEMQ